MQYEKIFVIGFNKSGTASFHRLFLALNLRSQHSTEWDLDAFQCFSDARCMIGEPYDFTALSKRYPNALFILNLRRLHDWLLSRSKHCYFLKRSWGYPASKDRFAYWIRSREQHYRDVLQFFQAMPEQLLLVSVNAPDWTTFVSTHLGFGPQPNITANIIPESAIAASDLAHIKALLNEVYADLELTEADKHGVFINSDLTALYKRNW